jgi:tRNA(Ile)-lysidine synthase
LECIPRARRDGARCAERIDALSVNRPQATPATFTSAWLGRRLRKLAGPLRGARLCVAFSGGADSTALLAALAALRARAHFQLRALHVNHHLQPGAAGFARAARGCARRLGVPCQVLDAPVRVPRGESPEAAARAVRYAALGTRLHAGEWLLLAQHQDDQVETLLLQLLRGAGVAGLAAMPERAGRVLRPLLPVTRAQLLAYLRRRRLRWSEDPSNADERYGRNFLRLRVLPALRERWPACGTTICRSAALAAEAQQLLAARADAALLDAVDGAALRVSALRGLGAADRRNALRRWLELRGLPMPDQRRLQELAGPLLRSRHDAQPFIHWPGALVRRHGDLLHAAGAAPLAAAAAGGAPASASWPWLRELLPDAHGELLRSALPVSVRVDFRGADGRVAGRPGGRRLKRLLQQQRMPPWQRRAVPLVYAGRRLLAVGDRWQAGALRAGPGVAPAARCRLVWRRA